MFVSLQQLLQDPQPQYADFQASIKHKLDDELTTLERIRLRAVRRLIRALAHGADEQIVGTADIASLLRQVLRLYRQPLWLPRSLWDLIERRARSMSLYVTDESDAHVCVQASNWQPHWLPSLNGAIDQLEQRRNRAEDDIACIGDGMLVASSKGRYTRYRTSGQKHAVHACVFAEPGSTTIVSLPTGSGKSQCITVPAWVDGQLPRERRGATLVVVPTVSLAFDQRNKAREFYKDAKPQLQPQALTGSTSDEEREQIRDGLRSGDLPLLFISPEALLSPGLRDICQRAAQEGKVRRLIIDEAHLVDRWGARFRVEFQLLSTFQRQLLAASNGQLRTILLSATITSQVEKTLVTLFAQASQEPTIIRHNQLRPEIAYWMSLTNDDEIHQERVVEAIQHLPRPLILYTTTRKEAESWQQLLRENGYRRVGLYTGNTRSNDREALLQGWMSDEIDLMIATSAFGVGVDKDDIRAILHVALPEDPDRFYQEVGRGGRDGYSSISLLLARPWRDKRVINSLNKKNLAKWETIWQRWQALRAAAKPDSENPGQLDLDTYATPNYNPGIDTDTDAHHDWHTHALLMMQLAGLIEITDFRPPDAQEQSTGLAAHHFKVRVLDSEVVSHETLFEERFGPFRTDRYERVVRKPLKQMLTIAETYNEAGNPARCIAHSLADMYPHTELACGGCVYCRRNSGYQPQHRTAYIANPPHTARSAFLDGRIRKNIGKHATVIAHDDGPDQSYGETVLKLLVNAVRRGFQQVVLPPTLLNDRVWLEELPVALAQTTAVHTFITPHRIIPTHWMDNRMFQGQSLYPLPTIIVYPLEDDVADHLYNSYLNWTVRTGMMAQIPTIHVIKHNLHLGSTGGNFLDRVEGDKLGVRMLLKQLQEQANELDLF